jgi:hypothetical protein
MTWGGLRVSAPATSRTSCSRGDRRFGGATAERRFVLAQTDRLLGVGFRRLRALGIQRHIGAQLGVFY